MTDQPAFEYRVGQPAETIGVDSPQWAEPLPAERRDFLPGPGGRGPKPRVTYGDYFVASSHFLGHNLNGLLDRIARASEAGEVPASKNRAIAIQRTKVQRITIHLVKHGAFYHPARVTLHPLGSLHGSRGAPRLPELVLNVAVSAAGRQTIAGEYQALHKLWAVFGRQDIPAVYAYGTGAVAGKPGLNMFAGQWFCGFCEFHPSDARRNTVLQWVAWDEDRRHALSHAHVRSIFRQAMRILTGYYNPLTCQAVLDWHPAAGDFVVKLGNDQAQVRLVTVRRYAPLFNLVAGDPPDTQSDGQPDSQPDIQDVLQALLIFLIGTSLRMRLDRLDGVGQAVWAGDQVVGPLWQGFKQGLSQMAATWRLPAGFEPAVVGYLADHGADDLLRVGRAILARHRGAADERALLADRLVSHITQLAACIAGG
jgi:hypothetical protein